MGAESAGRAHGVLIDVDGTLLDSNDAHALAWQEALGQFGHAVEFDKIRALIGKGGDKLLPEVIGIDAESTQGKAISEARKRRFADAHLSTLRPTAGARCLLERLVADGARLVVATSSTSAELQALLRQAGVADLLPLAVTSDDADASKPDPDIVQAALGKLGLPREAVFMLGDTPYDIEAASAAGVRSVALRCGGHWNDDAFAAAVAVFDDPGALERHLHDLPFYGVSSTPDRG